MVAPFEITLEGSKISIRFLDEEMCAVLYRPFSDYIGAVVKAWIAAEKRLEERNALQRNPQDQQRLSS